MFKLIKILNSGSNVPEPRRVKVGSSPIYTGTALIYNEDNTVGYGSGNTSPKCIALCDASAGSEAVVFDITPDMLFEAPVLMAPDVLCVGSKLILGTEKGNALGILNAMANDGPAIVYDTTGATKVGDKITVRLA